MRVAFDEMTAADGAVRGPYAQLSGWLAQVPPDILDNRRKEAELLFRRMGITFAVYGAAEAQERLIPFDVLPRILSAAEWDLLRRGLEQRVKALNLYIKDVYGPREALRAGVVPPALVYQNPVFRPEMSGQKVPHDIYVHIAGIDIVRVDAENFYVLEDNARTPSGVSYMLENREIMMQQRLEAGRGLPQSPNSLRMLPPVQTASRSFTHRPCNLIRRIHHGTSRSASCA